MQQAVELDPEVVIDDTEPTERYEDATFDLSTIIISDAKPISGEMLLEVINEAKKTNRTFASVAKERLIDKASVKTIISPSESIPDIASRTENKSR
ncbi:hypothetical protein ACFFKC_15535 [Pseudoduganella danionis]|uniref:hypothetical protein n=1 Tax=Pseudoduganella danionis TaxID=1890295 RepID=UPI001E3D6BE2|nr:hypothetical protein [Pseudoduganella danionis]